MENDVFCPGHGEVIGGDVPKGWDTARGVVRSLERAEPGAPGLVCLQSSFLKDRLCGVCFAGRSVRGPCSGDAVEEPGSALPPPTPSHGGSEPSLPITAAFLLFFLLAMSGLVVPPM